MGWNGVCYHLVLYIGREVLVGGAVFRLVVSDEFISGGVRNIWRSSIPGIR